MNTLGTAAALAQNTLRDELIPAYLECGPGGTFAVTMMRADLDAAAKAMIEGDAVAMLRVCRKLQEWQL